METIIKLVSDKEKPYKVGAAIADAVKFEVAFIEKGTQSGRISVCITLMDNNGVTHIAEITGRQFDGLCGAYQGAKVRWNSID